MRGRPATCLARLRSAASEGVIVVPDRHQDVFGPAGGADRLLTVPGLLEAAPAVVPTANEYLALPDVDATTGALGSVNVLHRSGGGLLELVGEPLASAHASVDGTAAETWELELDHGFLPTHRARIGSCELTLTSFCPPGHRGFVQVLSARNQGDVEVEVGLELGGSFREVTLRVFSARPVSGPHRCAHDPWTGALTWEASTGLPVAALAVRAEDGRVPDTDPDLAEDPAGLPLRWRHATTQVLAPGDEERLTLFWGVGSEADGAALTTVDLARRGCDQLLADTRAQLASRRGSPLPGRPDLERLRDRNRAFCLAFAAGRTIDTDELVLVTSRSPRYYVCGAHWSRDALLWAFPAVLDVDAAAARDWLAAAFGRYARNAGVHALYLDGRVLYPGYELDELCAFPLALGAYVDVTGDVTLLHDPAVRSGLERVATSMRQQRDPASGLLATALLPSDDPAPLPFVTYDNALAVAAHRVLARLAARTGDPTAAAAATSHAGELWDAVQRHCVVDGPFGPMYCGATDARGEVARFDEPPGSLMLLPYYGLVDHDDPVWRATAAWIHSEQNPHGPGEGRYATPSCPHAPYPWLLAVGNALLAGDTRWLDLLPELPLDAGFACETFDADTGEPRTGAAFASCAGWIAHAIDTAVRRDAEEPAP